MCGELRCTTAVAQAPGGFLDTGNGTGIDVVTLKGIVHDDAAFDAWMSESTDPVAPIIGALFRGRLADAATLIEAALRHATGRPDEDRIRYRLCALSADLDRERGAFSSAEATYRDLLLREHGSAREAVLWQHLGKVHFAAGDYATARDCFARSLMLRTDAGGATPADQVESSRLALARAEQELAVRRSRS